jgi:hypothetical protein
MAGRGSTTFNKRQREQKRTEKRQEKEQRREERRSNSGGLPDDETLEREAAAEMARRAAELAELAEAERRGVGSGIA